MDEERIWEWPRHTIPEPHSVSETHLTVIISFSLTSNLHPGMALQSSKGWVHLSYLFYCYLAYTSLEGLQQAHSLQTRNLFFNAFRGCHLQLQGLTRVELPLPPHSTAEVLGLWVNFCFCFHTAFSSMFSHFEMSPGFSAHSSNPGSSGEGVLSQLFSVAFCVGLWS